MGCSPQVQGIPMMCDIYADSKGSVHLQPRTIYDFPPSLRSRIPRRTPFAFLNHGRLYQLGLLSTAFLTIISHYSRCHIEDINVHTVSGVDSNGPDRGVYSRGFPSSSNPSTGCSGASFTCGTTVWSRKHTFTCLW